MRLSYLYINALLLIFSVSLMGCISTSDPSQEQPLTSAPQTSDFILSSGDALKVTVFGDEDLSGEYDVDPRGFINMPLIGDITVAGRGISSVQDEIAESLKEGGIIVNPQVSIEVTNLRPFYILGEVEEPGSYPSVPEMDAFKAIATAGGLTPRARKGRYIIYRGFAENRVEIEARDDTPVYPGDSIRVEERFF
jgi:polysaccharide export outer membrane protein